MFGAAYDAPRPVPGTGSGAAKEARFLGVDGNPAHAAPGVPGLFRTVVRSIPNVG